MRAVRLLETCLYAIDLEAATRFYAEVIGLERLSGTPGRHVFFRAGDGVFLLFNPEHTSIIVTTVNGVPIPLHGSRGPGHVAFAVSDAELEAWRARLAEHGIPVEAAVSWPGGGRSIYLRDPAGNSVELATPAVWNLPERAS